MYQSRHDPSLIKKIDLAKLMNVSLGLLYYRLSAGDIPDGDVVYGRKKFYSKQLANEIVKQWAGYRSQKEVSK
jgi:hypothetical protein